MTQKIEIKVGQQWRDKRDPARCVCVISYEKGTIIYRDINTGMACRRPVKERSFRGDYEGERVKVTAVVTVTLQLQLTQAWDEGVGMGDVHRQAKDTARRALDEFLSGFTMGGVSAHVLSEVGKVRVITEDV